jgi:hypothetical protein
MRYARWCAYAADLPAGPAEYPSEPPSKYMGAKVLLPGQAPAANIILAFEYGGGWRDIQVIQLTLLVCATLTNQGQQWSIAVAPFHPCCQLTVLRRMWCGDCMACLAIVWYHHHV